MHVNASEFGTGLMGKKNLCRIKPGKHPQPSWVRLHTVYSGVTY